MDQKEGVDRQGQPWVGFDYAALDLPEFLHNAEFRHFVAALEHMAQGIALEMFMTVLARHDSREIKAFEMKIHDMSDRRIGEELQVDHKTAQRWYQGVMATIREISPLGRDGSRTGT